MEIAQVSLLSRPHWVWIVLLLFVHSESSDSRSSSGEGSHLVIPGQVIHLFPRYGYLSLSMRVVPRNDSQNWIFLEPTKDVVLKSTARIQEQSFASLNEIPLHNEFHIDLCGWRAPSLAKYFGIEASYVKGDYRYMLVRVFIVKNTGKLHTFPNVTISPNFVEDIRSFRVNDYTTSFQFFNNVGTHAVNSFITGNAIYQVFVYEQSGYEAVKRRLREGGYSRSSYMAQLPYLLPLWVKHMGKVMVLNSSPQATASIREALTIRFLFSSYPNIFKMHDNAALVKKIEKYLNSESDGLLGLELKTLNFLFRDPSKRKWFSDSLQQTMHLWEVNL